MKPETQILVITSYPPRVCGIATYSTDLISALKNKFGKSFSVIVCALENEFEKFIYPGEVKYILDTSVSAGYKRLAAKINRNKSIKIVLIQHEFGFFEGKEEAFTQFLKVVSKPKVIVFHTVIPGPDEALKKLVCNMSEHVNSIIVMTKSSSKILIEDYKIDVGKIEVIAHGTHLVQHLDKEFLKEKYRLKDKKVLSTFGLLSSGKSIETTLDALPDIIKTNPEVIFLIIGKTHPMVIMREGERYRSMLEERVEKLGLSAHVRYINNFLALPDLLEFLQLTDIYLFTSNNPNQAVSGTFVYAMSCACPIVSTPIPHATEVLTNDTGVIFNFMDSPQLAKEVVRLFSDEPLRKSISLNTLQKIVATAWENSAISHAMLLEKIAGGEMTMYYNLPEINLTHIKKLTTDFGMIQFSKINQPDIESGYTLDDNSRALIAMCKHYELTSDESDLPLIELYLSFLRHCLTRDGSFLNYVNSGRHFTGQNENNLDDANGRAIWALGYVMSNSSILPSKLTANARSIFNKAFHHLNAINSTRAIAFVIKGLCFYQGAVPRAENLELITTLANRLASMYKHEATKNWEWFESYLTYANSVISESMLMAWSITGDDKYRDIAIKSFDFLLSKIFNQNGIEVISNKSRLNRGDKQSEFGEQPIDVAYTILALGKFYELIKEDEYLKKMIIAFDWFLGKNRLMQIVYNPCTGGCYDGLEENNVNLNQGAESTVSYLMARLAVDKYKKRELTS
jgi:glycosyltransferase involved in cell wall biosynthesis